MAAHLHPDAERTHERHAPAYYRFPTCDLRGKFKDFDNPANFRALDTCARSARSLNFVMDYGAGDAWCGFDLDATALTALVHTPRPQTIDSRWIHLWYPHNQTDIIKILAKHYEFSPRLAGLMQSKPLARSPPKVKEDTHRHHFHWPHSKNNSRTSVDRRTSAEGRSSADIRRSTDYEQGFNLTDQKPNPNAYDWVETLGHYDIVNSIWHWSSVDLGKQYLCVGYNTLHKVTLQGIEQSPYDLPNGQRIWNWLVLCHDKTVISISEGSPVSYDGDESDTRQNLLNVFRQLSKASDRSKRNPLSIVPIRYPIGHEAQFPSDTAGLLFYYFFDDWYTTYSLLAKHEHQYGNALNKLRAEMMVSAQLPHVDRLFRIGRQLATLKRMYQSYELIIDKVLEKHNEFKGQEPSVSGANTTHAGAPAGGTRELLGVHLSAEAMVRFERLRDRIRLYVLSEIQECIDTKEALLNMNFNLITIKESDSVERLTRITILLAKVTIMFLPVSLVTGYFSVQIPDVNFTIAAYWISFSVVLVISFIALFVFSKISGTTEGMLVYKPINQVMLEMFKRLFQRKSHES